MGMLVNGQWVDDDGESRGIGGKFDHLPTSFRSVVTKDGGSEFVADTGRYYIYGSKTCPWAHRAIIFRHLKGLAEHIGLFLVGAGDQGYAVDPAGKHIVPGTKIQIKYLHELYALADKSYTGRVTVPTLWDSKKLTIVNNESSEIIKMLNSEFNRIGNGAYDYYPKDLEDEIEAVNEMVYHNVNNGVYKAGFSTSQQAYEEAYENLFDAFDKMEGILNEQRYLAGDQITVADWRAFPTLFRFDTVYHYAFKCNKKHLYQYPNLWNYTRELYQEPGIAETCWLDAAKLNYWTGPRVNATGTIPKGPEGIDFNEPHNRARFA
ncbi:glutathione S-transferase C-terminal domain-containing protein [Gammaproteobacteria bacterium]|nr:glutathione S-transferase C-terminal domain-containing protein [Gammaproteobacteria bacterium]